MGNQIDRTGNFRVQIKSYSLYEAKSNSIGINLTADVLEEWNGDQWDDWREYQIEVTGTVWVVTKEDKLNKRAAQSLVDYAAWDGSFESIESGSWSPEPCAVTVEADEYNGEVRYKIGFINDYNREPGSGSNVDSNRIQELSNRFGSELRALAGSAKAKRQPASNGKPPAPPVSSGRGSDDDVPF